VTGGQQKRKNKALILCGYVAEKRDQRKVPNKEGGHTQEDT